MGRLRTIIKALFDLDNILTSNKEIKPPINAGSSDVLVRHNGQIQRVTFNQYGEIINRRNE